MNEICPSEFPHALIRFGANKTTLVRIEGKHGTDVLVRPVSAHGKPRTKHARWISGSELLAYWPAWPTPSDTRVARQMFVNNASTY